MYKLTILRLKCILINIQNINNYMNYMINIPENEEGTVHNNGEQPAKRFIEKIPKFILIHKYKLLLLAIIIGFSIFLTIREIVFSHNTIAELQKDLYGYTQFSKKMVGKVYEQKKLISAAYQGKSQNIKLMNALEQTGIYDKDGKVVQKGGILKRKNGTVQAINSLYIDQDGKMIQDILYNEQQKKERLQIYRRRYQLVMRNRHQIPDIQSTANTIKIDYASNDQQRQIDERAYQRERIRNKIDQYNQQLPICIVSSGYNCNKNSEIQFNLNSYFLQNYTNYFVIIINDASTDGSHQTYQKYFKFHKINPLRYSYIYNPVNIGALESIYTAVNKHCSPDSIVLRVDADDELIGKNALQAMNSAFQRFKAGVVYSSFILNNNYNDAYGGYSANYTQQQLRKKSFRKVDKAGHLFGWRASLFHKIKVEDLKDDEGKFFKIVTDKAIIFPLLQMSCGKIFRIDGYHYLYKIIDEGGSFKKYGHQANDKNQRIITKIKKPYDCDPQFLQMISK